MGPFEMVVAIVLIVMIAGVVRSKNNAKLGIIEDDDGNQRRLTDPDAGRMKDEIKQLKARIAVLERIATDKSNRLEDEIEALRDTTRS